MDRLCLVGEECKCFCGDRPYCCRYHEKFKKECRRVFDEPQAYVGRRSLDIIEKINEIGRDVERNKFCMTGPIFATNHQIEFLKPRISSPSQNITTTLSLPNLTHTLNSIPHLNLSHTTHPKFNPNSTLYHLPDLGTTILQHSLHTHSSQNITPSNWICRQGARGSLVTSSNFDDNYATLIICGGWGLGAVCLREVWSIDFRGMQGIRVGDMLYRRFCAILASLDQVVYIFGGSDITFIASKTAEYFLNEKWHPLPSMHQGRSGGITSIHHSRIYLSGLASFKVEVFNPENKTFTLLPLTLDYDSKITISCVIGDELIILQENVALVIYLNSKDEEKSIVRRNDIPEKRWFCTVNGVVSGDVFSFLNWKDVRVVKRRER